MLIYEELYCQIDKTCSLAGSNIHADVGYGVIVMVPWPYLLSIFFMVSTQYISLCWDQLDKLILECWVRHHRQKKKKDEIRIISPRNDLSRQAVQAEDELVEDWRDNPGSCTHGFKTAKKST